MNFYWLAKIRAARGTRRLYYKGLTLNK